MRIMYKIKLPFQGTTRHVSCETPEITLAVTKHLLIEDLKYEADNLLNDMEINYQGHDGKFSELTHKELQNAYLEISRKITEIAIAVSHETLPPFVYLIVMRLVYE